MFPWWKLILLPRAIYMMKAVFIVFLLIFCHDKRCGLLWKVCDNTFLSVWWWRSNSHQKTEQNRKNSSCFVVWWPGAKVFQLGFTSGKKVLGKTSIFILKLWCEIWKTSTECNSVEEQDAGFLKYISFRLQLSTCCHYWVNFATYYRRCQLSFALLSNKK